MILEIIVDYVVSNLIDKHRDKLPQRVVSLIKEDISFRTLLEKNILPNTLEALKTDYPELRHDEAYVEKVVAPAIAYVISQSVSSGQLYDTAEMRAELDKLLAFDSTIYETQQLNSILQDYLQHYHRELAKHQDPGDALVMRAMSTLREEILSWFNTLTEALAKRGEKLAFQAEHGDPIFISYARDGGGREFAAQLRQELESYGFRVWQDIEKIEGGKNWLQQIYEAIDKSIVVVFVVNAPALKSKNVRDELNYARRKGKPILPVTRNEAIFDDAPRLLRKKHIFILDPDYADYASQHKSFLRQLNNPPKVSSAPFTVTSPPGSFVDRPDLFEPLVNQLLDIDRQSPVAITTALQGGGGFGKTTLAKALCYDQRIREAYDDGVLWIDFGESPDVLGLLNTQIRTMGGEGIETEKTTRVRNCVICWRIKTSYLCWTTCGMWHTPNLFSSARKRHEPPF